jgi:large subunit ribosomal protein L10
MSKQVKQMQMDVLAKTFRGVQDMVFIAAQGIDAQTDNKVRLGLRKKNISLLMVKNTLLRRVFNDIGVAPAEAVWAGPTVVAWGAESIKDLSKELEAALLKDAKLKDKVKVKAALAEGQPVTFEQALKMPTRKEAIGEIVAMILGPAASIASALTGPAAQVASQLQTIADKKPEGEAAPAA